MDEGALGVGGKQKLRKSSPVQRMELSERKVALEVALLGIELCCSSLRAQVVRGRSRGERRRA